MKNRTRLGYLGALAVLGLFGPTALAATESRADAWSDRLAAGKKEGSVTVAGPSLPGVPNFVVKQFEADTGIKVNWKPLVDGPGPFTVALLR